MTAQPPTTDQHADTFGLALNTLRNYIAGDEGTRSADAEFAIIVIEMHFAALCVRAAAADNLADALNDALAHMEWAHYPHPEDAEGLYLPDPFDTMAEARSALAAYDAATLRAS